MHYPTPSAPYRVQPIEPKPASGNRAKVSRAFHEFLEEAESVQDVVKLSRNASATAAGVMAPLAGAWQGLQQGMSGVAWLGWLARSPKVRRA